MLTSMPNRIKELRKVAGITEAHLAALVGTTQPTIHRLETGKRKLTVDWMTIIAEALNCSASDLIAEHRPIEIASYPERSFRMATNKDCGERLWMPDMGHFADRPTTEIAMPVGIAIQAAIARGKAHETMSPRWLRVKFVTRFGADKNDGLRIIAVTTPRSPDEHERMSVAAPDGSRPGVRFMPWADLDAHADELLALVDDAVAEILATADVMAEDA